MSKKLFVGGLSWDTSDAALRGAFARFGDVAEARVITEHETNRSRGFGFVTMVDADSTDRAMQALDGSSLDGRRIRVNPATERPRRGQARW